MISKKGWTMMWTANASAPYSVKEKEGLVTSFVTSCGVEDTRIFGELLKFVEGVPSACHCKQVCTDGDLRVLHRICRRHYGSAGRVHLPGDRYPWRALHPFCDGCELPDGGERRPSEDDAAPPARQ